MTPSIQKLQVSTFDWTSSSQVPHLALKTSEMFPIEISLSFKETIPDVATTSVVVYNWKRLKKLLLKNIRTKYQQHQIRLFEQWDEMYLNSVQQH